MNDNNNKVIDGLKALASFTDRLADEQIKRRASFASDDQKTTDANIQQAAADAKRYAESRNRHGSFPARDDKDDPVVNEIKAWSNSRNSRFRGLMKRK